MVEINNTTKQKINLKQISALVEEFLRVYKKSSYTVSIALVGTTAMRRLNLENRGIDRSTDVLSFSPASSATRGKRGAPRPDWPEGEREKILGEVVINLDELKKTGNYRALFKTLPSVDYLFKFILVHGLLHLVGYDDQREPDRQAMLARGQRFLDRYYL